MVTKYDTRMAELVVPYLTNELSEEEQVELDQLINESDRSRAHFEELTSKEFLIDGPVAMSKFDEKASWKKLKRLYSRIQAIL